MKGQHRAYKKKIAKFKARHPEGRTAWSKHKKENNLPKYQPV
jgi:hypothetical protein